ncbi:glycosyltransferase family 2 protein [Prevotella melaninogenica]|uniref:glycosyltransferase family 2 protein n=1 Tax=Prevotella melaninogenica TaxID=28132 RepID=UPI003C7532C6
MRISIIIPIFKVEKYIKRCLESVVSQDYSDIECILVNDCSPDDSFSIAKDFVDNYTGHISFSLVAHNINKGLSEARNTGINQSKGDYIYFLDSDDAIPYNAISTLVKTAVDYNLPEIVYGRTIGVQLDGSHSEVDSPNLKSFIGNENILLGNLNNEWTRIACNKLIRKDLFFTHKTYFEPGLLNEDELWSFEVSAYINSLIFCDKVTYLYYVGDSNSITRSKPSAKSFKDNITILERKKDYLHKVQASSALAQNIYRLVFSTYYSMFRARMEKDFMKVSKKRLRNILNILKQIDGYNVSHIPFYMKIVFCFF